MSEELSDEEYQQALDDVIELMRSMSRPAPQMPKMHPGDLGMMTPQEFVASVLEDFPRDELELLTAIEEDGERMRGRQGDET